MAAFDQLHEFRLDLARDQVADAAVLADIGPFADQVEMVRVLGIAAQDAVLDLRRRSVERVVVAVVELVEQLNEFVAAPQFYTEIVDVEVVSLARQRYQCHRSLPQVSSSVRSGRIQNTSRPPMRRTISCRMMPSSDSTISTAKTPGTSRLKFNVVIR